ncbi:uncharacterized protein LOC114762078, partial [Neltuma alba]|uniref:uncharacterized protein LOC114762078 n=1 Tax=Neltuma alba TaxID=207710 RepID=UPI0010A3D5E0
MDASNQDPRNPPQGSSRPQLRRVRSAEFRRPSHNFLQIMNASNGDIVNPPEVPSNSLLRRVESAVFKRPSLDLLQDTPEARMMYLKLCVPLHKYASEGNWEEAKLILGQNRTLLSAAIAQGWSTILHVAVGAGHFHFVEELVNMMEENKIHLDLQDSNGNTAFSLATIAGNLEIVQLIRTGFTPILFAALQGRADLTKYLYPFTVDENFEEVEWKKLFLTCIDSGIYDLALHMLKEKGKLAFATDEDGMTGLHIMAQTADLGSYRPEHQIQLTSSGTKNGVALDLVHLLWEEILNGVDSKENMKKLINEPSRLLFDAAKEVRKIVLPSYMKKKNSKDKTPCELFTEEHAALRKDAESWMKGTAKSCMLVSTLIATGVFTAAFSTPGGIKDDTGVPNYLGKRSFTIFAISDAIAMISSSASILIFLSILISRYAEYDFHHSLPSKLIFGLITLFISITSMMIAFSSAFFVTYDRGLKYELEENNTIPEEREAEKTKLEQGSKSGKREK